MTLITILKELEPSFIEAGQIAYAMQKGVHAYLKRDTGNFTGDVVTDADLKAQEFLLGKIKQTELVTCRLMAEEDTPGAKGFSGDSKYYLAIDPIDDTAIYARGGKHFSTIVTLHDGKNILYTFVHFPAWNWTFRIANGIYANIGVPPAMTPPSNSDKTIVHWSGTPEKNLPKEVLSTLHEHNADFKLLSDFSKELGTIGTFAAGVIGGVYQENPNVYDGLTELNIARARGQKVYISENLNLTDTRERESGLYYPGWYLVLDDTVSKSV